MTKTHTASTRVLPDNTGQHPLNNNGTFRCSHTLHFPDHSKRASLGTQCIHQARKLRDRISQEQSKPVATREEVAA